MEEKNNITQEYVINKINRLCEMNGYDYITLSRKSNVPLTTLLNIVKGNTKNVGVFTIVKLCNGFDITLAEFFIEWLF